MTRLTSEQSILNDVWDDTNNALRVLTTLNLSGVTISVGSSMTSNQGRRGPEPWPVSGTVVVSNFPSATVVQANQGTRGPDPWPIILSSGTVSVTVGAITAAQGARGPEPWPVSGTVTVTGTVPVSFSSATVVQGNSTGAPWIVSGTIVSSITGTVPVSFSNPTVVQGNSTGAPWIVSGTVTVGNTLTTNATITNIPTVIQGNSTGAPWIVSGTTVVSNTVTVGTHNVNQGFHGPEPWAVSGTVVITGTVPVSFSNPTVIQGNSTGAPWIVSGTTVVSATTPGTGATNLGKAEDAPAGDGDTGVAVLGVRNDALSAKTNLDGDYTQFTVESTGRTVIAPYAPSAAMFRGSGITTGTSDTFLMPPGGAGIKSYIVAAQISNTGSSTAVISFKDGSGGQTLGYAIAPAGGGGNIEYPVPLVTSANTALFFAASASSTSIYVSAQGYKAP